MSLLSLLGVAPLCAQGTLINGDRVQAGTTNFCADAGSTDAYACNFDPAITAYFTGAFYYFKANTANTGAATLNINSVGAKTIKKVVGGITTDLSDNDIRAGQYVLVMYDGTNMQMLSMLANFPAQLAANGANCSVSGTFPNGVDASGVAENCVTLSAVNAQTATYQVLAADFDSYKTITVASGTFTITLVASGSQPAAGKYLRIVNYGSGVVTIARSGQNINGGTTSLTLPAGSATAPTDAFIISNGTDYFAAVRDVTGNSTVVRTNAANTWSTGAQDMGSATSFKVPTSAGAGPTTSGVLAYDSTSNTWEGGVNGSNAVFQTSLTSVVKSIFIPAASFEVSGSCAQNASAVLVTNGPKLPTVTCTDNDADGVEFDVKMPGNWNASTIQIELDAFSIGNNNTEVLELDWAGQCVRSGDSPAAHSTTGEQPTTITWGNAANREQFATSSAITLNGTCAAGSHLYIRGQVDATATTMSPMTDLKIVGVRLLYTTVGADQ